MHACTCPSKSHGCSGRSCSGCSANLWDRRQTTSKALGLICGFHWKQLYFGSILGSNGQIMYILPEILKDLHAHIRAAEVIINFLFSQHFQHSEHYNGLCGHTEFLYDIMTSGIPLGVGHGVLCNIRHKT